jgi:polar amino acid transport system substrate-binding protein
MMKKHSLKRIALISLLGLATLAGGAQSANAAAKTIVVGTSGAPKPYTYVNDKNKITGYDIEILRAIDKITPQYKFTYKKAEIPAVLGGVDSGRFQIGANNFGWNKARAKKYTYSKPIFNDEYVLAVRKDDNSIKNLSDISGKTTENQAGVNFTLAVQNFNKAHPKAKAKQTYTAAEEPKILQDVQSGKYDFNLLDGPLYDSISKQYHFTNLKAVKLKGKDVKAIGDPHSHFLTSKTAQGKAINKALNKGLVKLEKNGTLTKISKQFFGKDYSPKA